MSAVGRYCWLLPDPEIRGLSTLHLEMGAKQLILLEGFLTVFSKYALKSLNNQSDFDSAIRRFDPSRPSHSVRHFPRLPERPKKGPEIRAFLPFGFAFGLRVSRNRGQIA